MPFIPVQYRWNLDHIATRLLGLDLGSGQIRNALAQQDFNGAQLSRGRPNRTPRSFARLRPTPVRARINSRSNSARPPSTVSISRPWALVVSAQASLRLLKPAPRSAIAAITLSRSRVDLASRSSRVTTSTSPGSSRPIAFTSSGRSVLAPDTFSLNTLAQPA